MRISRFGGLAILLGIAALLRLPGLFWGLPDALRSWPYNTDESYVFRCLEAMNPGAFDFNPRSFIWPGFFIYIQALWLKALSLAGAIELVGDRDFYRSHPAEMGRVYLWARILTLIISLSAIPLAYGLARRAFGRLEARVAALLIAVFPLHAIYSPTVTAHLPADTFGILSALFAWRIASDEDRATKWYPLAGAAIGLAAATLYDHALFVFPLLAAHLLRVGWRAPLRDHAPLVAAGGAAIAAFAVVSPYFLLDHENAVKSLAHSQAHFAASRLNFGNFFRFLGYALGPISAAFAVIAVIRALAKRERADLFLLAWIVPYSAVILWSGPAFMRRHAAIMAPLAILIGRLVARTPRALRLPVAAALVASSAITTLAYHELYRQPDLRTEARGWVDANIPEGAPIAVWDWHLDPHLDLDRNPVGLLTRGKPAEPVEWIVANSFFLTDEILARDWPSATQVREFRRPARFGPVVIEPEGAPEDWLYPAPVIRVFRIPPPSL